VIVVSYRLRWSSEFALHLIGTAENAQDNGFWSKQVKNCAIGCAVLLACDVLAAFTVWGIISFSATSQSVDQGHGNSSDSIARSISTPKEINWHDSYAEAIAEAKTTGKPLFLEFRCVP
jgi:hypothetical protein